MADLERLRKLLGGQQLAGLRARLRKRYENGREGGAVTLAAPDDAERAALCDLLGRRLAPGASLRFEIDALDAALRHCGAADSLYQALSLLDGPITNRAAQRATATVEWEQLLASIGDARLARWLAAPRALGSLKRASSNDPMQAARICADTARVLAALPCAPMPRSHLAARLLGDAHALDTGRAVPALALAVLRHARDADLPDAERDESERAQWAACGILVNELARPVLVLNLPGNPDMAGEPDYFSLRSLVRNPRSWDVAQRVVFVCENPNIVAIAADTLGPNCAPLVCTEGMPAAAQRTLLSQLASCGAHLRYHGDFDWPGIGIANVVMDCFGAQPWRFGTQDYLRAAGALAVSRRRLDVSACSASWDDALCDAMRKTGAPIDEESVAEELLFDLDTRHGACD